jgi:hypothetical protein
MRRTASLSRLLVLAKQTRTKFEKLSQIENGPANLAGYCGVASKYLESLAVKENIPVEFISGIFRSYNRMIDVYQSKSGHSWIEHDGYIVDVTATQFKHIPTKIHRDFSKKIYVCRITNPHYEKLNAGRDATEEVTSWYEESLEEICEKADLTI